MPLPPTGVRIPTELHARIKASAAFHRRSVNSEIVFHLGRAFSDPGSSAGGEFGDRTPADVSNNAALARGASINHEEKGPRR